MKQENASCDNARAAVKPTHVRHVAIIMDGNGRWAKERSKPRIFGHRQGAKAIEKVMKAAMECGVSYLTLYAFSSENWSRPKDEVSALMRLLVSAVRKYKSNFVKNEVRVHTIGDLSALPQDARKAVESLKDDTRNFGKFNLVLALNYGSRDEIVRAVARLAKSGKDLEKLSWKDVEEALDTKGIPEPDLVIRTSGEKRLSNFLMLQAAYSELYFTDVYWPDFDEAEFKKALADFSRRERRYGKTGEQLK